MANNIWICDILRMRFKQNLKIIFHFVVFVIFKNRRSGIKTFLYLKLLQNCAYRLRFSFSVFWLIIFHPTPLHPCNYFVNDFQLFDNDNVANFTT